MSDAHKYYREMWAKRAEASLESSLTDPLEFGLSPDEFAEFKQTCLEVVRGAMLDPSVLPDDALTKMQEASLVAFIDRLLNRQAHTNLDFETLYDEKAALDRKLFDDRPHGR